MRQKDAHGESLQGQTSNETYCASCLQCSANWLKLHTHIAVKIPVIT